jgi:hypothetical protein
MHRRTNQENSALMFRGVDADEAVALPPGTPHLRNGVVVNGPLRKQLFSTFLSQAKSRDKEDENGQVKDEKQRSVSFAVDLRVLVPEYEIDNKIFFDTHYEGGYIYRDRLYILARPAPATAAKWEIFYAFESHKPNPSEEEIAEPADPVVTPEGGLTFVVPILKATNPGIDALLRVTTRLWNRA